MRTRARASFDSSRRLFLLQFIKSEVQTAIKPEKNGQELQRKQEPRDTKRTYTHNVRLNAVSKMKRHSTLITINILCVRARDRVHACGGLLHTKQEQIFKRSIYHARELAYRVFIACLFRLRLQPKNK